MTWQERQSWWQNSPWASEYYPWQPTSFPWLIENADVDWTPRTPII